jgi:uncharacterized protein (DUF2336 family)
MLKRKRGGEEDGAQLKERLSYEEARDALATQAHELHRELAQRTDAPAEILYYLAESVSSEIRTLVAGNPFTPHKANLILCDDTAEEVRCDLARKIARLVPGLDAEEQVQLREGAIEVMERLAADHLPRVRQILAEEIKQSNNVPHAIVRLLAQDAEQVVSVPIIEYSPLLCDDDLIEIIAMSKVSGVLEAVARRPDVSEHVSDAVVATLDIPAVAALLANPNAQIREQALDAIIENAGEIEAWHRPLVLRPDLSLRAMRRVAGFVANSLVDELCTRHKLDEETTRDLKSRVRARLEDEPVSPDYAAEIAAAEAEVHDAQAAGTLDDAFVHEAAEANKRDVVIQALALRSTYSPNLVKRILVSRNGKAITSLAWKAGLTMRTALSIQTRIALVPRDHLLMAREGVHYPLTPDEMEWHLEYFAAKT